MEQIEREVINGKPYFGNYYGTFVLVQGDAFSENAEKYPLREISISYLKLYASQFAPHLQIRHVQIVEKPPRYSNPIDQYGSIGIKFLVWGRAFEVMKLKKLGKKRFKKTRYGGRIKRRRVD